MKPLTPSSALLYLSIILFAMTFVSCKQKGCTDKNALNFDVSANEDDGSCVYCKTSSMITGSNSGTDVDYNYNSGQNPNYGVTILSYTYTATYVTYNSTRCGNNSCNISFTIQNLIYQTTSFTGLFSNSNTGKDTIISNISIPPGGSITIPNVFSTPASGSCGTPFASLQPNGYFTYH